MNRTALGRPLRLVHVVLPAAVDDPRRPSGGNRYDLRVCRELEAAGWAVRSHRVTGAWPSPDPGSLTALARLLARLPDRALVLVDGLVGSAARVALTPEAERLRLVLLVHLPLGVADPAARGSESGALGAASSVIVTSRWTRDWLVAAYGLDRDVVHVAEPGVDPAPRTRVTMGGTRLLTVGAVAPVKGQDLLVEALAQVGELTWDWTCAGSLDVDPAFAIGLRERVRSAGLARRVRFSGGLDDASLAQAYAGADLLVVPSRMETFGMAVTEALARGLPVLAFEVGGVARALGRAPDGARPGLLVAPADPAAMAESLRRWLTDPPLRTWLGQAAAARRRQLSGWSTTGTRLSSALLATEVPMRVGEPMPE